MTASGVLFAVIIPLVLAELGPWCGWLAGKLLPWAAVLRYGQGADRAAIRVEEWSGHLSEIPGQLTKLAYSLGQLGVGSAGVVRRNIKHRNLSDPANGVVDRVRFVPHAILRLAAIQLHSDQRDIYYEWLAELQCVLLDTRSRPVVRLIRGTNYALGLLTVA